MIAISVEPISCSKADRCVSESAVEEGERKKWMGCRSGPTAATAIVPENMNDFLVSLTLDAHV